MSESHSKCEYGYFMKDSKDSSNWVFVPFERQLSEDDLAKVAECLRQLNENK